MYVLADSVGGVLGDVSFEEEGGVLVGERVLSLLGFFLNENEKAGDCCLGDSSELDQRGENVGEKAENDRDTGKVESKNDPGL